MNAPVLHSVRAVQEHEIDECMEFAMPLFSARFPHMLWKAVREAAEQWIKNPDVLLCRTDHVVGLAAIRKPTLWEPFPVVVEEFVGAAEAYPFEHVAIYRAMTAWGKQRGARAFDFGSANGINIEPIAKRLGAVERQAIYRVEM